MTAEEGGRSGEKKRCGMQRRKEEGCTRERRCEIQGREGEREARLTDLVQFLLQLFTTSLEFL